MKKLGILFFSTGFGLGYCPFAPGTVGSLPGILLAFCLTRESAWLQATLIAVFFLCGIYLCNASLKWFEGKDPRQVTIDEVVSMPVTFFLIPLNPITLGIGFLLNRILDITKPWPAYQSQSLPKGLGIMIDDLISAIYSNLLMQLLVILLRHQGWMA